MAENIVAVRLSRQQADYLINANFLNSYQTECIREGELSGHGGANFTISRELAEEFREAFTVQLAKVGFDDDYAATAEGLLLEELIDRFYAT